MRLSACGLLQKLALLCCCFFLHYTPLDTRLPISVICICYIPCTFVLEKEQLLVCPEFQNIGSWLHFNNLTIVYLFPTTDVCLELKNLEHPTFSLLLLSPRATDVISKTGEALQLPRSLSNTLTPAILPCLCSVRVCCYMNHILFIALVSNSHHP